ncbi:uncharacterized protein [Coffea arabica]|uniref:Endonuclease/exonuclease/phosphatase domain-containing protein n=1 Tax=Coffea arabica TaxID=13443 RepID=A0ABM4UF05_COFAR
MKVVVWNCRGVGGPLTIPQLKEVTNFHSPKVVFLCETKNQEGFMGKVQRKIKYDNSYFVNSIGRAGGLALFWNNEVTLDKIVSTDWCISARVEDKDSKGYWGLVCVYASTDSNIRKAQWKSLEDRMRDWGEDWIIVGDFNDLRSSEEKWGGRDRAERCFREFNRFIKDNNLVDLGYQGVPWTWCNSWEGDGEVKERLDRCLCSTEWLQRFEKAQCTHLETEASDHLMLLVDTNPENRRRKQRFYFDQRWTQNPEAKRVIQGAWTKVKLGSRMFRVATKIKECRMAILEWRKNVQGNSKVRIKELKEKLAEVKARNDDGKRVQVDDLKAQLTKAYAEEEMFWSKKSRSKWLKEGDKNTAFFHSSVMAKRRRNKISTLQKKDGTWCKEEHEIEEELCEHYKDLFTTTNPDCFEDILAEIPSTISSHMNEQLI